VRNKTALHAEKPTEIDALLTTSCILHAGCVRLKQNFYLRFNPNGSVLGGGRSGTCQACTGAFGKPSYDPQLQIANRWASWPKR